nr:cobyrinate a,c-diamide synthase [Cryptosporangium arvum]
MTVVPRLVIAAPASGHGKTTVATGLLAAYKARGLRVSPHKVGPDYIDPGYHALASGRPGRNLDPYLVGPHLMGPLFAHGAAGADLAVVEGVMGLYDGAVGHGDLGSTAQVAAALRAPVVLVVDSSAQGRSVAALVHGFRTYEPSVWLGGVILNRVGSERHEKILRDACEEIGTPVFGALRRRDAISTPSRHLGLVPVAERSQEATEAVDAMGRIVAESVDLDRLLWLARSAPPVSADPWSPSEAVGGRVSERPVIAVAAGAAFTFGYAETVELLEATGAVVARFDPLHDESLPEGAAGLVVGGGFPEVHAEALSANEPLKKAVRELAASGAPIAAECAGLLWLTKSLDGKPMCGVLDAEAGMTPNLTLGYRSAVAISDSQLLPEGTRVHGHVFHRTQVEPRAGARPAWQWQGRPPEGFVQDGIHASYLHLHWAAHPVIARRLVDAAARLQRRALPAVAAGPSNTLVDAPRALPPASADPAPTKIDTPADPASAAPTAVAPAPTAVEPAVPTPTAIEPPAATPTAVEPTPTPTAIEPAGDETPTAVVPAGGSGEDREAADAAAARARAEADAAAARTRAEQDAVAAGTRDAVKSGTRDAVKNGAGSDDAAHEAAGIGPDRRADGDEGTDEAVAPGVASMKENGTTADGNDIATADKNGDSGSLPRVSRSDGPASAPDRDGS